MSYGGPESDDQYGDNQYRDDQYRGNQYPDNPYDAPDIRTGQGRPGGPSVQMPEGAATILVCGILSLIACAPVGIAAWVMGNTYMRQCHHRNVEPDGVATAGRICGIIGTVLFGVQVAFGMLWLLLIFGVGVANM